MSLARFRLRDQHRVRDITARKTGSLEEGSRDIEDEEQEQFGHVLHGHAHVLVRAFTSFGYLPYMCVFMFMSLTLLKACFKNISGSLACCASS